MLSANMTPYDCRPPHSRYIIVFCLLVCAASLTFALRGLFSGYSYWHAELFSVSASMNRWHQLFELWILPDVHPPLYQVALKIWMSFFGSTEIATRLLSFSFSIVTLGAFSFDAIFTRRWRRALALLLVSASPYFAYYSQETRSYSLVLALSSVITLAIIELRSRDSLANPASGRLLPLAYYLGSLLLSLTHYFGWIYVFVLSLVGFWENKLFKARARMSLLVVAISLWPAWHVAIGNLGSKSGGDFWISVNPPIVGTLTTYLRMFLPAKAALESPYILALALSLMVAMAFVAARNLNLNLQKISSFLALKSKKLGEVADESRFCLFSIALMVSIMSIVDLYTNVNVKKFHSSPSCERAIAIEFPCHVRKLNRSQELLKGGDGFILLVILFLLSRQSG